MENSYERAKLMFFSWATQWIRENPSEAAAETEVPDIHDLLRLHRCLGFKLRHSSSCTSEDVTPIGSTDSALSRGCRLVLSCDRSGQRFILEGGGGDCSCPPREMENTWHVTARVPTGSLEQLHSQDTAGSSSMPPADQGMSRMIREVSARLMKMLHGSSEMASAPGTTTDAGYRLSPVRYRSLDTLMPGAQDHLPRPLSEQKKDYIEAMDTGSDNMIMAKATTPNDDTPGLIRCGTWTSVAAGPGANKVVERSLNDLYHAKSKIDHAIQSLQSIPPSKMQPSAIDNKAHPKGLPNKGATPQNSSCQLAPHGSAPSLLEGKSRLPIASGSPGFNSPRRALSTLTSLIRRDKTNSSTFKSPAGAAARVAPKIRPYTPVTTCTATPPRKTQLTRTVSHGAVGKAPHPSTPRPMTPTPTYASRMLASGQLKPSVKSKIDSIRKTNTTDKE